MTLDGEEVEEVVPPGPWTVWYRPRRGRWQRLGESGTERAAWDLMFDCMAARPGGCWLALKPGGVEPPGHPAGEAASRTPTLARG